MKKSKGLSILLIFISVVFIFCLHTPAKACTTVIVGKEAAKTGVPMLWKNRDTSFLSNKVIYVKENPYSYIGLINAEDTSGRFVYAGLNSEGFGIMNSVAYNLPEKDGEMKDLEGNVMAEALRTCKTADDFENWLKRNLGPSLGCWTNFGVIDAEGNAVIFEVHNNGYKKYDTADAPEKYLVNANFARSGEEGQGTGYLRFQRAEVLFKKLEAEKISHDYIFQAVARDMGNVLLNTPSNDQLVNFSDNEPVWAHTGDTINREYTSAAVVIMGKKPGDNDSVATMWVLLGEPVTSIALPFWVEAGNTPKVMHEGETAPLYKETLNLRKIIRPYTEKDRKYYIRMTKLDNKEKTGFLPLLLKTERDILKKTEKFLKKKHTPEEYAAFQEKMAHKALETLKKITTKE